MFDSYSDDQMSEIEPENTDDGIYSYNEVYAGEVEAWRQEQIESGGQNED